jgi:acetyl-CoA carboxylase carboxyl transferase subunit beta
MPDPTTTTVRPASRELIDGTLDPGSFVRWDEPLRALPVERSYTDQLERARARSGVDESIITGAGTIDGRPVAVVAGEFAFLGGSIGVNAADRIVRAFRRATAAGLPVLAAPVSGGTRMQEGTIAFLQMAKITQAVSDHRAAALPYLVYLRNPTTGGVFASWGSLGHITVAEPGALIGFLGPKVYQALHGSEFPAGVQTAENLFAHGLLDAVLDARHLRKLAADVLRIVASRAVTEPPEPVQPAPGRIPSAWESVLTSRSSRRPGLRSLLRVAATDVIPLSGTGEGESDRSAVVGLARFGGLGAVVVGLDRRAQSSEQALGPGALRQARRGMALASELHLPLVTVVDTPGAALSKDAEEGGLGGEIARCLAELLRLDVPTVSVILGQGTGGGALAFTPADRVVIARNGWLAPLPPEGASAIRFGDTAHAAEVAGHQRIRSADLLADGIVDEIVEEFPDAADEPDAFCLRVGDAIVRNLSVLTRAHFDVVRRRRALRYDRLGAGSVGDA